MKEKIEKKIQNSYSLTVTSTRFQENANRNLVDYKINEFLEFLKLKLFLFPIENIIEMKRNLMFIN